MTDREEGKLARVVDGSIPVLWVGDTPILPAIHPGQKIVLDEMANRINAAVSRLVEEERKKALDSVCPKIFRCPSCGNESRIALTKSNIAHERRDAAVEALEMAIHAVDAEFVDFEDTQHREDKVYNEALRDAKAAIKALADRVRKGEVL